MRLRAALALAVVAILLGGLELGSRAIGHFDGPLQPLRVRTLTLFGEHDPLLFWRLRPYAIGPGKQHRLNGDGLRGPEIGAKPQGEVRILSLGESTTFGAHMPLERTYSGQLERMLNESSKESPGDRRVRVINAGVPGYTLFQGVQFLLQRADRFEPDLVLLYFGYNDFLSVAYLAERASDADREGGGLNDWELFEARQTVPMRIVGWLIRHSNAFRAALQAMRPDAPEDIRTQPGRPRVPAEHRAKLLEMARAHCAERGIELVLVVPIYREFDDHAALLREFAAQHGVALVDLPAVLRGRFAGSRADHFLDAVHPNPAGHRLIAEAIFERVAPMVH